MPTFDFVLPSCLGVSNIHQWEILSHSHWSREKILIIHLATGSCQYELGGQGNYGIAAICHTTMTCSVALFRTLVVPNASKVTPAQFDNSTPVVVAQLDSTEQIGKIFGVSKIRNGTRLGSWSASRMDLVFLPKESSGQLRAWWTMHDYWSFLVFLLTGKLPYTCIPLWINPLRCHPFLPLLKVLNLFPLYLLGGLGDPVYHAAQHTHTCQVIFIGP